MGHGKGAVEGLIFSLLFFAGASFYQPVHYDNTLSRFFLIGAVVDHGTLNIDAYHEKTIDKSFSNGHYYSNKAFGASLLGIPVYWCLHKLKTTDASFPFLPLEMYLIRLITTTVPFALLGVILFRLAYVSGADPFKAFLMVLAYSLGSIAFLHAILFSGHQIAACFAFFSFFLLFRVSRRSRSDHPQDSILQCCCAGLLVGFAVLTDYTALLITLFITLYVFSLPLRKREKIAYLCGGCVCIGVLAVYNFKCFGSVFSMSYALQTHTPFQQGAARGIFGITTPDMGALAYILFSPSRGLFFIMPFFFLSFAGLWKLCSSDEYRREGVLIVAIVVGYITFNAGYYCWHGGWTFGPRFLVPMLPFLAFPMAFGRWKVSSFVVLFVPALVQVFFAVAGSPHVSVQIRNPIIEFIIPCMVTGYMADNTGMVFQIHGIWSAISVMAVAGIFIVLTFRHVSRLRSQTMEKGEPYRITPVIFGLCMAIIILMLGITRTRPPEIVHYYQAKVLRRAAITKQSPELMKAAMREARLADINSGRLSK